MVEDGAYSRRIDYVTIFFKILNVKGHQNCITKFGELVDFAYLWSFRGGGSAINGATLSCFHTKSRSKTH